MKHFNISEETPTGHTLTELVPPRQSVLGTNFAQHFKHELTNNSLKKELIPQTKFGVGFNYSQFRLQLKHRQ